MLVSSVTFDSAGNQETMTDPAGMVVRVEYDDAGREITKIMNPSGSSSSSSSSSSCGNCACSDDTNIIVRTAYNADGNVASITAENASTGNQTTQFVYGTTLSDSDVASSLLKREEIFPDSVGGSDKIVFNYNRQQQFKNVTDQAGTVHSYDYDKLGRMTQDRASALGANVDGAVRRIAMAYEVRGMRQNLTSYDNSTVGSGSIVNDVQFAYNDFSQLTADYQSHSGAVNTMTTPKVQYSYANGAANTVRPMSLTYPDGRVISFDYGSADSMADAASRIASIVDDDMAATHLTDYSYLGERSYVINDYTEPDVKWTLAGLTGSNDPDTGDIYSGLDRFGRVKDNRWYDYGASADADRIQYGYDRAGNRVWRQNTVAEALSKPFDEVYGNDLIHRLKELSRGILNGNKDAVTDPSFGECWSLDATGNWQKYLEDTDGNGTWDLNQARTANTVNEITGITESAGPSWATPAYSAAGNMTTVPQPADPTKTYTATYDAWNRLVKLVDDDTSDTVAEYQYDGANRRTVQKNYVGGVLDETRHLYYTQLSQWQVVEERVDAETDPDRQFVWGQRYIDDLVLRDRDTGGDGSLDERLYALQDANWNVTALINASGDVQERFAYSAYGTPLFLTSAFVPQGSSSFDWETLYAGYRWESLTELFHVRHRVLNSALGTWCQRDPIQLSMDSNLSQYVLSSPTSFADPFGEIPWGFCPTVDALLANPLVKDAQRCICSLLDLGDILTDFLNPDFWRQRRRRRGTVPTGRPPVESPPARGRGGRPRRVIPTYHPAALVIGAFDCLCSFAESCDCPGALETAHDISAVLDCAADLLPRLDSGIRAALDIVATISELVIEGIGGPLDPIGQAILERAKACGDLIDRVL